jgi:beta-glucanase (GH16 family)
VNGGKSVRAQPLGILFAVLALTFVAGQALAAPGEPLNRGYWLGPETFTETFDHQTLDLTRWNLNFWYGDQNGVSSRIYGDGGFQVFSSPLYNGVNPFYVINSQLVIRADRTDSPADPLNGNLPYTSGMISSFNSFSQQYGYFEVEMRADEAPGMWPAFWLLGANVPKDKNMEIDVVEALGTTPRTIYQSTHYVAETHRDVRIYPTNAVNWAQNHTYGVLVTPTLLIFYVDEHETSREANAGRFNMPMYMVVSLGIGPSYWYNNVPQPDFHGGKMIVTYVRAYALKPSALKASTR